MNKIYIYGKLGTSFSTKTFRDKPEADEILMSEERPGVHYVAQEDGSWVIPTPSLDQQIIDLQSDYGSKLSAKLNEINVAVALDDTKALATKREEYAALVAEQKTAVDALILGGAA